jgi:hypothetical protein
MPISNILKSASVMIVGGLIGYNVVKYSSQKPVQQNRFLASVPMAKLGSQQLARTFFETKVHLKEIAKNESETSILKVTITALKNIPAGLTYNWILPKDVHLVSGFTNEQVGTLNQGESKEFEIQVNGFSKELRKYVSFEIHGQVNQWPLRHEVLLSSRIEDSLEYLIHQNELKKNSEVGVQKLRAKAKSKFAIENVIK